jgi:hypothetical protein
MTVASSRNLRIVSFLIAIFAFATLGAMFVGSIHGRRSSAPEPTEGDFEVGARISDFEPKRNFDLGGFSTILDKIEPWRPSVTLSELAAHWRGAGSRLIDRVDSDIASAHDGERQAELLMSKAMLQQANGDPENAYKTLDRLRALLDSIPELNRKLLYTIEYFQGVCALRIGENENCIMCRGESSCIIPIAPSAIHTKTRGSRLAIQHFSKYLERFPQDVDVRWLLNLAHMTLGEYPAKVDPKYLIALDRFQKSEFDLGVFRDVSDKLGIDRTNQGGGAILDDFDGDGLLDIVMTSFSPVEHLLYFHNRGDGRFEDRTDSAGLADQFGGLACFQADYDNDGNLDIFIPRGAWLPYPVRPSLLRNAGDGTFVDVTERVGLLDPVNAQAACWGDYDNDGFVDLFVGCENQPSRLYHNNRGLSFDEVAFEAGVSCDDSSCIKGATWIDFDDDDYPDLFVNDMKRTGVLFKNNRDGSFVDVTRAMGIDGPRHGFACWAWDYDNDGRLDLFATSYERELNQIVDGLNGTPSRTETNRLYHNEGGKRFQNVTAKAGLDRTFATMGCNFGDFDNDGYLDFYLGTGAPSVDVLVPNRMFKNVQGNRFAEITGTSRTGHLQKGHGVACGDWDRDGDVDVLIESGGAIDGDKYHNMLFQNPNRTNRSLTVKLVGVKTNRSAFGARIKLVTAGENPLTVYRHVSTGSSFGANPLEQTIGVGSADQIATLEIHWPTSRTTQVFHNIAAGRSIEITEFQGEYRDKKVKPIPFVE